jgi:site-specific recombinase XerD
MSKYYFNISFYLRKSRANNKNECPIYIKVSVNESNKSFSTNRFIDPSRWDHGKVKGNKDHASNINTYITTITNQLHEIYNELLKKKEEITPAIILDKFFGRSSNEKSLIEVFEFHNQRMKSLIGIEYVEGTLTRYKTSKTLTKLFIQHAYKKDDILLSELKYSFITDYEHFLKAVRGNSHNTTSKYIKNFKKIIKLAVNNEWLEKDPFTKYSNPLREVKREYLTQEELKIIEDKKFSNERLRIVKDIFIFSCFTGLAYADVKKLTKKEISKGLDKQQWIFTARRKTGTDSHVPLLPKAIEVIEKYKDHPDIKEKDLVFPVKSNQKMNQYLKEIADLCEINKPLTFHIARHTFATLMLTHGISIESVSSMLGHKNIKTTQHYGKIIKEKVSKEMKQIQKKLM